jgi:hypothetical protein
MHDAVKASNFCYMMLTKSSEFGQAMPLTLLTIVWCAFKFKFTAVCHLVKPPFLHERKNGGNFHMF